MGMVKRLVCLANSRKLSGRCVAGIELVGDRHVGWIRPISSREHEEVSEHERQYENGSDPRLFDIIDVPLIELRPRAYQQENWLLDPDFYWTHVGRIDWSDLSRLAEPTQRLWIDGASSYNGSNDRIKLAQAEALRSSLRLVHVSDLQLSVFKPGAAFGDPKRRVQGRFTHAGSYYRLWVTDPVYERIYLARPDGVHAIGEAFLTVSLGEAHSDGYCYKLIAAIMEHAGVSRP